MKTPVELNSLLSNFFCYTPGLLYHLIRRDYGRKRGLYVNSYCFFKLQTEIKDFEI